jgi:hypothetical protein
LVKTNAVSRIAAMPITTTPPGSRWKSSATKASGVSGGEKAILLPVATSRRPAAAHRWRGPAGRLAGAAHVVSAPEPDHL